jgi:nucleoside-diphosphate-sugar epimerase
VIPPWTAVAPRSALAAHDGMPLARAFGTEAAEQRGVAMAVAPAKVVVTGAAGFVGSHLVDRLLDVGHVVVALDRRDLAVDPVARLNLASALTHPRCRWVEADLTQMHFDTVLDGVDTVFHLAAVPGVRKSWGTGFPGYVTANVLATNQLLGACVRAGVRRLVYASSSSVYGPIVTASKETHATAPLSPYGVTKLAGEQLCLAHAMRPGSRLTVVALRFFSVYGPRQRPDMAIGRMLAAALSGTPYTLFGDGTQRRDFTYVGDVVEATVAAGRADASAIVVNVGGGTSVSMAEALRHAGGVIGSPVRVNAVATQAGDVAVTAADLSVARALLGYRPRTDLRSGMTVQAEWLRSLPSSLLGAFAPRSAPIEVVSA